MSLFTNVGQFADKMIRKYGMIENWYFIEQKSLSLNEDPTKGLNYAEIEHPIQLVITSWENELIDKSIILNGDKKGLISYNKSIDGLIKPDTYIIKKDKNQNILKYKIVAPVQVISYKDSTACYVVNLRG